MLTKLKEIQKKLSENGEHDGVECIKEYWGDGGGAPVYLEDVIQLLEKDKQPDPCIHRSTYQAKNKCFYCKDCGGIMPIT